MVNQMKEIKNSPNELLIKHLQDLLKHAKSGELQGLVDVGIWTGRAASSGWVGIETQIFVTLGALESIKHEIEHAFLESEYY